MLNYVNFEIYGTIKKRESYLQILNNSTNRKVKLKKKTKDPTPWDYTKQ